MGNWEGRGGKSANFVNLLDNGIFVEVCAFGLGGFGGVLVFGMTYQHNQKHFGF